jgi:hypothetical protein
MERTTLNNGIVVEVQDKTVRLSGDLYMVHLEFTTMVTLGEEDDELKRYCGGNCLSKTRVFKKAAVHERYLEEVKNTLKESYLRSVTRYLEHPKFIERFKRKSLDEFRDQKEKALRTGGYEE